MQTIYNFYYNINWIAILIVLILSFILGAFWHSSLLFGKTWTNETHTKKIKTSPVIIFGLSALAHFIAITLLALIIGRVGALKGLIYGFVISVCWITTSMAATYLFASRSLKLFLIDAGFYVIFFSLAGLIIGACQ